MADILFENRSLALHSEIYKVWLISIIISNTAHMCITNWQYFFSECAIKGMVCLYSLLKKLWTMKVQMSWVSLITHLVCSSLQIKWKMLNSVRWSWVWLVWKRKYVSRFHSMLPMYLQLEKNNKVSIVILFILTIKMLTFMIIIIITF